jgi:hypothetical protein
MNDTNSETYEQPSARAMAGTWHGWPRTNDFERAHQVVKAMTVLLGLQRAIRSGGPNGTATTAWFDPLARGARLRGDLAKLPVASDAFISNSLQIDLADLPGEPFILDAGGGRLLVTPEGQELIALVEPLLVESGRGGVHLSWWATDEADQRLLAAYRSLSRQRLESVLRLRGGEAAPLLPAAIGQILLLLLNGNIGRSRALRRPDASEDRAVVDEAVAAITGAFVDSLQLSSAASNKGPSSAAYSLYGGYALTEARRRLGDDLATDPIFVADGAKARVILRMASELARRPELNDERLGRAVDALAGAYGIHRPVLSSYGLAQGHPGAGAELNHDMVEQFLGARRRRTSVAHA